MLRITFEKPEAKNLLRRQQGKTVQLDEQQKPKKKKQKPVPWTWKERAIIFFFLLLTLLLSGYFWYRGNGGRLPSLPQVDFGVFGFSETVILK